MRSNDDILALMDTAVKTFGRLDVLHNNAGIHESDLTTDMTVDSLPIEVWDTLMDDQPEGRSGSVRAPRSRTCGTRAAARS